MREREEGKKEREIKREMEREGGSSELLPLFYRRFDSQSSSCRELKSVYSTRATLQEVGIIPTLVISSLRAV